MTTAFPIVQPREEAPTAIQKVVGPFFLGIVINYFLWGIQVTQSYKYYKTYRTTDPRWTKIAVLMIFLVDGVQSICASQIAWGIMVSGWGNLNLVNEVFGWGANFLALTHTVTVLMVQTFYAHVVWRIFSSPYNHVFTGIILALSLTQLSGGIGQTAFMNTVHIPLSQFGRIRTWVFVWVIPASVCDVLITTLLTIKLSKSRTGIERTDGLITKLIRLTVENGFATAFVQTADLVVYLIWPVTPYHAVFTWMTPKVYSNSILALLNSRVPRDKPGESISLPLYPRAERRNSMSGGLEIHTSCTISRVTDFDLSTRKTRETDISQVAEEKEET